LVKTVLFRITVVQSLGDHGGGSGGLVLPVSFKLTGGTVVPGKSVDTALDKNQAELGVLILTVALQVLTNLNSLLDKHVQILWDFRGKTVGLEDTHNLLSGNRADLSDSVRVTKDDTNLGGGKTLLGELADVLLNVGSRNLAPTGGSAFVRAGTLGDTLSWCVHASHLAVNQKKEITSKVS
jgi:hypothetical protein